jgi:hypothetical protein
MEFKPSVFVGSSREGFNVAEKICNLIKDITEPHIWNDVFDYNSGTYESLSSQIALYDFAILVATGDDVTVSRKRKSVSARDNVLFEFGLFSGGLGRSRVFYVVEKNMKIPSDLVGSTLPMISEKGESDFDDSVAEIAKKIKEHIADKENTYDLGFLPSTALAYGYFANFIERTIERLLHDKKDGKVFHLENGNTFTIKDLKCTILIPDDLSNDMFKKVAAKRLKGGWQKLKVDPRDVRDYDFTIDVSKVDDGILHLVDIPLTLNALNLAITLYSQKAHLGKGAKEKLLEYREIRNFKRTLEYQIQSSSLTRQLVTVEVVDI